jgi:hypothetical protein
VSHIESVYGLMVVRMDRTCIICMLCLKAIEDFNSEVEVICRLRHTRLLLAYGVTTIDNIPTLITEVLLTSSSSSSSSHFHAQVLLVMVICDMCRCIVYESRQSLRRFTRV